MCSSDFKKTGEFVLVEGNNIPKSVGDFTFYLHRGEFIPANSQVTFVSNGIAKEFSLRNLLEQKAVNGTFYLKGSSISGAGLGFGVKGEIGRAHV